MSITIEFNNEETSLLEKFSKIKNCTITDFIKEAVLEKLEDMDDYEIAVAAWNEFEKGGLKGIPVEEVFKMSEL